MHLLMLVVELVRVVWEAVWGAVYEVKGGGR